MAKHGKHPGSSALDSKAASTGSNYPDTHYKNPWNGGIDSLYGSHEHKTLVGPTDTPGGMGIGPLHSGDKYDDLWEKGK